MNIAQDQAPGERFRHWMREARMCEEDGHPDAARAAYAQAAIVAPSQYHREVAEYLGASLPGKA